MGLSSSRNSKVTPRLITIPYKEKSVEACITLPDVTKNIRYGVILTHGAGGNMHLLQLKLLAENIASRGIMVVRFTCKGLNLAYRIKVYTAVLEYVIAHYKGIGRYFLAGRSMGARAAVGAANNVKGTRFDSVVAGVIALSYPLHTKDNKSLLRDGPLYDLNKPLCFISGTEDEMCDQTLMENVLRNVDKYDIKWIKGANHALHVKGTKEEVVVADVWTFIYDWCEANSSGTNDVADSDDLKERRPCENNSKRNVTDSEHCGNNSKRNVTDSEHCGNNSKRNVTDSEHCGNNSKRNVTDSEHCGNNSKRNVTDSEHCGNNLKRKAEENKERNSRKRTKPKQK